MKIFSLVSESWHMDGGVAFGVVPKSMWSKLYPSDERNLVPLVNRLLLVETGNRLVLVDTGFGTKRDEKYYSYKYITHRSSLPDLIREKGYQPEEVTDVILTHLHDDHVGGAVYREGDRLRLTFPNAEHWVSQVHYQWAANPNPREAASFFRENIDPVEQAGKLRMVEQEGEIIPGIHVKMFHGHTGGQMLPFIETPAGTVAYMGDFIPSKVHIPVPYLASVDIQPLSALEEKKSYLPPALSKGHILFFEHDFYNECCRLISSEKGITGGDSALLSELVA